MTKKQRQDFLDNIPKHVFENGYNFMSGLMKGVDLDQPTKKHMKISTELTIKMATEVLLDVGATIKWPEKSKPKRKVVK